MFAEYMSIHCVDGRLRRHPKTIRRWCGELGIPIHYRPYHDHEAGYIHYTDFEKLREHGLRERRRSPRAPRGRRISGPEPIQPSTKIKQAQHEMGRRIEAAQRWKARHFGALIESEQIIDEELNDV